MGFPATAAKRAQNSVPLLGLITKKLLFYSQNKNCSFPLVFTMANLSTKWCSYRIYMDMDIQSNANPMLPGGNERHRTCSPLRALSKDRGFVCHRK